ncbi:magnesium/cobalt transporter CorA [Compostimonas suwonensis]|uniref:Magnesium transport protein CorA n=1 Tax=Compostimonas suwonensis TaxID=1048394 RepID=A0A2M9BUC9_9MICO|nr:magnesium/cobalt transporter CorA [Compostimonas suwonensis]PJJ61558.1 magnesium transporter [Compostimonas suwonensis]
MPVIDNAIYVEGRRTRDPQSLDETYEVLRERNGTAWIGLYRPGAAELDSVAQEFGLHPLAVHDALAGHQRSKLERYGDTLFVVVRPARYLDAQEVVEFGELHIFVGAGFVVTIRHAESPRLANVRQRMEAQPELLALGPEAILYAILDDVVDEYGPVVAGLENDIDEIEDELFGRHPSVSRRIYDLLREVIGFQRAVHPLDEMLGALLRGSQKYHVDIEVQRGLRDVLDHVVRIAERADSFRVLLQNALIVDATLVSQQQSEQTRRLSETSLAQNEELKKISSWAAILLAPTIIGTVYGMNFDVMPELHWALGYPLAIAAMVVMGAGLYAIFKRKRWL